MNVSAQRIARPMMEEIQVKSTLDGVMQPCRLWRAHSQETPRPLYVVLHTWSGDYTQPQMKYIEGGMMRNWHCIMPNFRGPNWNTDGCGSLEARQDILDAIMWAKENLRVDADRVYIAGGSGGGHMTLRMAGHAPQVFAAASAWCPISDLAAWYREHVKDGVVGSYAQHIAQSVGGVPGSTKEIDEKIHDRSPVYHMHNATALPLDISHGIHDGKKGSVPFWHSIWAYNRLAEAQGLPVVTQEETQQLWNTGRLSQPLAGDTAEDALYEGRPVYLRRTAGKARLTIFEGGHDSIPNAACAFVARFSRRGEVPPEPSFTLEDEKTQGTGVAGIAG